MKDGQPHSPPLENGIPLRVPCSLFGATRVELRDLPTLLLRRDINPQPRCQAMSCTNLALGCTVAHGRRGGPERVAQDQDVFLVESFGSVGLFRKGRRGSTSQKNKGSYPPNHQSTPFLQRAAGCSGVLWLGRRVVCCGAFQASEKG